MIQYTRNADLIYDLFYMVGDILDAGDYVTGEKKFTLNIGSETTAPPCTQIILQFEHVLEEAGPSAIEPYPKGRHSRYLANIPEGGGHVEFEFLDRPDESVLDSEVNAAVLLFAPGKKNGDSFQFYNLASSTKCTTGVQGCIISPVNACAAVYMTVEGMMQRGRSLQETDCSDCANPSCVGVDDCSVDASVGSLQEDSSFTEPATTAPTERPVENGAPESGPSPENVPAQDPVTSDEAATVDQTSGGSPMAARAIYAIHVGLVVVGALFIV